MSKKTCGFCGKRVYGKECTNAYCQGNAYKYHVGNKSKKQALYLEDLYTQFKSVSGKHYDGNVPSCECSACTSHLISDVAAGVRYYKSKK